MIRFCLAPLRIPLLIHSCLSLSLTGPNHIGPAVTLYLIRHAQSHNNSVDILNRVCDPPLTPLGHSQAKEVASFIRKRTDASSSNKVEESFGFARLYCSPMRRALETAGHIRSAIDVPVEVWPDLHETYGIWLDAQDGRGRRGFPGLSRSRIQQEFPGVVVPDDLSEEGWWNRPIETESQWQDRAKRVARRIREELVPAGVPVAAIIHGGFATEMLNVLLADTPLADAVYEHGNTAVTRLDFEADGRIRLVYLNRQEHLPQDLLS